jgi:hypothetical protein
VATKQCNFSAQKVDQGAEIVKSPLTDLIDKLGSDEAINREYSLNVSSTEHNQEKQKHT